MSYRLKIDEKPSHGIRRIARREVRGLRKCLKNKHDQSASIHKARTHIKKLRALARLVRERLGRKSFHEFDDRLKKIADSLSPLRDADVQLHTLQGLKKSAPIQLARNTTRSLQTRLTKTQRSRRKQTIQGHKWQKRQTQKLLAMIEAWSLRGLKKKAIDRGLSQARDRWQAKMARSQQAPTVENLHAWRKAAKDLTHQLALVEKLEPVDHKTSAGLKELGRLLGDDHDLAMFEMKAGKLRPPVWRPIQSVIRGKRKALQRAAFGLAQKMKICRDPI